MGFYKMLKTNARRAMAGGWGRAVGLLLIGLIPPALMKALEQGIRTACNVAFYADYNGTPGVSLDDMASVSLASTIITLAVGVLILIVMAPLGQGISRWFYRRTGGENESISTAFYYFESAENYFKALWMRLFIGVRIAFWAALLALPLVAAGMLRQFYLKEAAVELPGFAGAFFALLIGAWGLLAVILLVMISLRYLLAPYLLAENPGWKARQAIRRGVRLSKGHKGELFTFGLSFAGWWLPGILAALIVCAIPFVNPFYRFDMAAIIGVLAVIQGLMLFYVAPYMRGAWALYGRYLICLEENAVTEQVASNGLTKEYRPEELSGELPQTPSKQPPEE